MTKKKAKKETLGQLKEKVQKVVNKYIRLRDAGKPCISSGVYCKLEAGHFYPVRGYDSLRFDEDNINGEGSYSNRYDQGHLIGYAINLKEKIGEERFYALIEKGMAYKKYGQTGFKWTRQELHEIKEKYLAKIRELE